MVNANLFSIKHPFHWNCRRFIAVSPIKKPILKCMYICTYHVHLIWILMSGKYKYEKDKSNSDFLWLLCHEKFWFFRTVLIGEMSHNWLAVADCIYEEGLPNIRGNAQCSILNFLTYEENFIFFFISEPCWNQSWKTILGFVSSATAGRVLKREPEYKTFVRGDSFNSLT